VKLTYSSHAMKVTTINSVDEGARPMRRAL
jgi:hypothetical protein